LLGRVATLLAIFSAAPALAQTQPTVKELMGRAQSESEKKAVEDLIEKLRPRNESKPATGDSEAKRETTPGSAPAAAAAKEPGEATPREGTAAGAESKPASAEKSAPDTKTSLEERPSKPDERSPTQPAVEARPEAAPERVVEKAERKELPSVDLEVQFEYDSATLTPAAMETLRPLGLALSDERLAEGAFLVAGHTDAKGSTQYNLRLSEKRAGAVRQYLIENFRIDPGRLVAKGFGETHLKVRERPRAAENRRVQIVNYKE
jgi:outer membrane protein OmpA-like peptidoglycan-associated protein